MAQISEFSSKEQFLTRLIELLASKGTRSVEVAELIVLAAENPEWLREARDRYRSRERLEGVGPPAIIAPAAGPQAALVTLLELLAAQGAESDEVVKCLAAIALNFEGQFPQAKSLVESWANGQTPQGAEQPAQQPLGLTGLVGATGAVGIGTFVMANWGQLASTLDRLLIDVLGRQNTPLQFYGMLALAGFVGGMVYGLTTSDGEWLPKRKVVGQQKVLILGVLGKAGAGALAALLALGISASSSTPGAVATPVPPVPAESPQVSAPAPAPGTGWRLTGGALLSAFLVGLGGANFAALKRDRPVLVQAVGAALEAPADSQAGREVKTQKSLRNILETVQAAGQPAQTRPLPTAADVAAG